MSTTAKLRPLWRNRDFLLYELARFFGTLAIQMQSVAVGWQIYELTRRPLDLGYAGLAQFLPALVLSLVTGHAADTFDRRRLYLVCTIVVALCSFLFMGVARLLALGLVDSVLPLYGVLVLFGIARAFANPAGSALVTHLTPEHGLSEALALDSMTWQCATICGPALGGLVYTAAGAQGVYGSAGGLVLAAALAVSFLRVRTGRMDSRGVSVETLLAGVRYVARNKILLGVISLDLFAVLLGGAVALLPVYARDILHAGPWALGLLRSGPAIGASAMALFLAFRPLRSRVGMKMLSGVFLFGLGTIVFGLSTNVIVSLGALIVLGASDMVSVIVRHTLVQIVTPPEMRGRVAAVNQVFVGASNELGEFESGLTAAWFGVVPAVVVGGVGTCLVVAAWGWLFPQLRGIDALSNARPEDI